jgi:hypothetical protein
LIHPKTLAAYNEDLAYAICGKVMDYWRNIIALKMARLREFERDGLPRLAFQQLVAAP